MKKFWLLLALAALCPNPAQASWAIALFQGHNPITRGNDHIIFDQGPDAITACNAYYHTSHCKVVAKTNTHSCGALANNGAKGTAIRWSVAQNDRKPVADAIALRSCRAQFGGSCKVVNDFCR